MRRNQVLETAIANSPATDGLVRVSDLQKAGVSEAMVRRGVADGLLVRVRRGVYAQQPLPRLPLWLVTEKGLAPEYTLRTRALLMSWRRTAARRRTAALLRGWELLVEPRKVELAAPHGSGRRKAKDALVQQVRGFAVQDVVPVTAGAPVPTVPAWQAVLDGLLSLPPLEAVALADSALRAQDVTLTELEKRAAALPGTRHARHARRLLAWCDPEAGSVLESALRYRLHEAGISGFDTQVVIRHAGAHVLRADFCFADAGLVVETDGARWHDDATDKQKSNALAAAGWRVLRFGWHDVIHGHASVIKQIASALATDPVHFAVLRPAA